jgi:amino acid adenylation domain-containing protein
MIETKNNSLDEAVKSLSYWQNQLAGSPPLLDLPTDLPRRSSINFTTETQNISWSGQRLKTLTAFCQDRDVDLFIVLLAAFKVLMYRYTSGAAVEPGTCQDILIGSSIMRENVAQAQLPSDTTDGLMGGYFDKIVFRTDLSGNPTFIELIERVRSTVTAARAHQDLSFDQLLADLQIDRSTSYHPLFQVMFILEQNSAAISSTLAPEITPICVDTSKTGLDLILKLTATATEITGYFEYAPELFFPATIARMVMNFQELLITILAHPTQSIDRLSILAAAERSQLLDDWNQTKCEYPHQCIHQLFEAQVERTPDAIAVVFEDQQLSYRELNDRANQVAHYLQSKGIGADRFVGLYVERSLLMMVGLFGILKAGAAYVPIDPHHPLDRIEYVIDNAQIEIILTQQQLIDRLPARKRKAQAIARANAPLPPTRSVRCAESSIDLICLDTDWKSIAVQSISTPPTNITPDHIAYLIYTSGSTGKPKGVEARHRGVVNFITSMQQQPGMTATDILLSVTTLSFDMAVLEIYLPITVGAKLVLVSREDAMDGRKLAATIDRLGITIMQATPSTWRLLLESQWRGSPNLKILTGAEPISTDLVAQLLPKSSSVWNLYGPTETTVWSTAYQIKGNEQRILIGKPIANTEIYILDSYLQPVPIGISGELYIGGAGLARGYWQQPDLTAKKFIPHPFSDDPAARIYRTGDLARYLPTGEIECLGRIDFQVKLRGFRIELGEIETLLCQYPGIAQAIAIIREDKPGDRRLVSYLILDRLSIDPAPTIRQLREFLTSKLPSYMVPAAFVLLDRFPLTPNGKIDRRALPAGDYTRQLDDTFVASQDEMELQLTKMWEQVLGIKQIGIKDNFFELGGYSLLAVRLITEIEKIWHQKLPLATFLAAPTIAEFANILRQEQGSKTLSSLVPIVPSGSKPPLFCVHPVGGNILEYYPLSAYLGPDQPIYGLQSIGLDGKQTPFNRIEDMAASYIQSIQSIQPDGPYFLAGYSFGGLVAFEIAAQLKSQGYQIGLLALIDNQSPNLSDTRPSLLTTAGIHLRNLQQLGISEGTKYIKDRIQWWTIYRNTENREKQFLLDQWAKPLPPEYLQVLEANFQAGQDYQGKFYPGKVTLFRSFVQPVDQALVPDLGWGELAEDVEIYDLPGHHSNLLKEPYIQVLAQKLKLCLERSS